MKFNSRVSQQGVALVISMLVLLVMTMIGLAAIRTTTLEEKMAGNLQDKAMAFQAAEAAVRAGENYLEGNNPAFGMNHDEMLECKAGGTVDGRQCKLITDYPDPHDTATYTTDAPAADYTPVGGQQVPRFFITFVEAKPWGFPSAAMQSAVRFEELHHFHVTARGTGGSTNAQSVVRSFYSRR